MSKKNNKKRPQPSQKKVKDKHSKSTEKQGNLSSKKAEQNKEMLDDGAMRSQENEKRAQRVKEHQVKRIVYQVKTMSNCLIGSHTQSFMVGGVDQATAIDEDGYPIIPGSAIKGALREIMQNESDGLDSIEFYYKTLSEKLEKERKDFMKEFKNLKHLVDDKKPEPNYKEWIFGVSGINNLPRLFFSDLKIPEESKKNLISSDLGDISPGEVSVKCNKDKASSKEYFLIDSKASITTTKVGISSNPRTYRVIKPGVVFEGEIYLKGFTGEQDISSIKEAVIKKLELFNEGYYSIGNSKSRGYGRIKVKVKNEQDN